MSKDFFMDVFNEALQKQIEQLKQSGLSDEEVTQKIEDYDFQSALSRLNDTMTKDIVAYMESTMYERVIEARAHTAEFLARHEQIWGKGFVASEAMYIMALEVAQLYGKYLDEFTDETIKDERKYRFVALREIHARACQEFLEIIHLIKFGFADGAYARWRSMYELSIIAEFIINNSENVAESFIAASESDDKRYDWAKAAPCFSERKGRVTFNDLQNQCEFSTDDWKRQYALANKVVHASPQGTFKRLGVYKPTGVLAAGHSDYGVSVAAEHAAISLSIITTLYLTLFPYGDGIVHVNCLRQWVDIIRKYYFEAESNCFSDENIPRSERIDGTRIEIQ